MLAKLSALSILLACAALPLAASAQQAPLIDPTKAPIRLTGGWEGGGRSGEIRIEIQRIAADGRFEGRVDLYGGRLCKVIDEPIKEGRITSDELKLVVFVGPKTVCGDITFALKRGASKYLEGTLSIQAGSGATIWLDAPK